MHLQSTGYDYRIAVIDDDAELLILLGKHLERLLTNVNIVTFTDPVAALEECEKRNGFDCIIIDMLMPLLSGKEFYVHLRTGPHKRATPIIFMSCDERELKCVMNLYDNTAVWLKDEDLKESCVNMAEQIKDMACTYNVGKTLRNVSGDMQVMNSAINGLVEKMSKLHDKVDEIHDRCNATHGDRSITEQKSSIATLDRFLGDCLKSSIFKVVVSLVVGAVAYGKYLAK